MGILIATIILVILSFLWMYFADDWNGISDNSLFLFTIVLTILIIELLFIIFKPIDNNMFQSRYYRVANEISQCQEIKEYALIENITDINQTIEYYKEFSNNPMINIFFSKDIANMELLPYSK